MGLVRRSRKRREEQAWVPPASWSAAKPPIEGMTMYVPNPDNPEMMRLHNKTHGIVDGEAVSPEEEDEP